MKRLLFAQGFPPSIGGAQNFMMSRAMAAPENLTVIAAKFEGYEEFDQQLPFKIIRFDYPWTTPRFGPLRRLLQMRSAKSILYETLNEDEYSVVELSTPFPGAIILDKRNRKFRLISFALGADILRPTKTWYSKQIFRKALRQIDLIIAISKYTRNLLLENGCREDRIFIINPPIHEKYKNLADGTAFRKKFNEAEYILLTVCRLEPNKGVDKTIESVAQLSKDFPGLHYVVVGGGSREEPMRLQSLTTSLGVSDRVHFWGRANSEDMPSIYASCDIFVMPTRMDIRRGNVEGYGIAYAEASSQGKPVVGPNIGGATDAIIDGLTGYCVDPNNVDEISARIRELINNPELRKQMGMAGREFALRPVDWSPLWSVE
jgi:phosphatidylinositol alpha-1,6-mannosyltransferase